MLGHEGSQIPEEAQKPLVLHLIPTPNLAPLELPGGRPQFSQHFLTFRHNHVVVRREPNGHDCLNLPRAVGQIVSSTKSRIGWISTGIDMSVGARNGGSAAHQADESPRNLTR